VPVPPLVWRGLGITFRRILPSLLTAERREIEVAPCAPHRFVAAVVDEVRAEHPLAVADEHIVAVPFINAEVLVEAVGDVYQGISQPIRFFRRAMSACDAREAYTRVVSRAFRCAKWAT
jgi:tRNA isopentenyl-2-thiomethyl-A-37 hydroxylase MiaE